MGDYCILEPLEISKHGKALYQEFKLDERGEDWTYLPFGPFNTYSDFEAWLSGASQNIVFYTIIKTSTNHPQGLASYNEVDQEHGVAEVGNIIFSKSLQKTRAATETMYLMMKHIFDDLGYRRYQWRCNSLNKGSRKAAERLGFEFEGIFRQAHVFKGYNRDTAWFSIIDREWPTLKLKFQKWLHETNFDVNGSQITRLQDIVI